MKESGEGDGKITFEVIFFVTLRIFMQLFFVNLFK